MIEIFYLLMLMMAVKSYSIELITLVRQCGRESSMKCAERMA